MKEKGGLTALSLINVKKQASALKLRKNVCCYFQIYYFCVVEDIIPSMPMQSYQCLSLCNYNHTTVCSKALPK